VPYRRGPVNVRLSSVDGKRYPRQPHHRDPIRPARSRNGQWTERVYDSPTGRILLIPQGARLIGRYGNVVASGQKRALIVWQRLVIPDGSTLRIDDVPATDGSGYAGLED
jgi:hypothetical protein